MNSPRETRHTSLSSRPLVAAWCLAVVAGFAGTRALAADLVKSRVDARDRVALTDQRPAWIKATNERGKVADDVRLNRMTVVLKRSVERQRAFDALLRAQQDPSSSEYQQWLSADEIGARFGASPHDIDAVTQWLAGQGLRVDAVSESRLRIRFSGTARAAANAFGTSLHHYVAAGEKRIAAPGAVQVPAALADTIAAVIGLESVRLRPLHHGVEVRSANPPASDPRPAGSNCQGALCSHAVFPADFARIYNLEGPYADGIDGRGQSIAIVSRARVSDEDMRNFQELAELPAKLPTTIIPPDGIDPGPAATTCSETAEPRCDDPSEAVSDQMEATLDVQRAGSAAPGATIKLIASASDDTHEGVFTALEYAIDTNPPPAKVISISYGTCEADNSAGNAAYLDALYGQAAMQGISLFVSSGDSGAGECASHLEPPNGDQRQSTNLLCTSEHVTCVGGTQFSDEQNPDLYWNRNNSAGFLSARGYIPEGAWNEAESGSSFQLAATGGGVSQYVATPAWQIGAGIPAEREGRYVPDVSLGASLRTGYFTCMAAVGGSCATVEGRFNFIIGAGTSASAPGMAGIAALLNQSTDSAQGNLNPRLYALAGNPANGVFHDITIASSGVDSCDADVPSSCNNASPGLDSLTGGASGYLVGPLHDRATGLGSLDVGRLLANWSAPQAVGISMNQRGLIGSWANPATDGQGVLLDIEPDFYADGAGLLFGGWFTHEPTTEAGQRWLTIQGQVTANGAAVMPIYATVGGSFDSPQPTTTIAVGTATVSFQDCTHGRLDYDLPYDAGPGSSVRGSIPLTRLLSNVSCVTQGTPPSAPAQHALAGAWADPGNSGQGLVLDIDPTRQLLFGAWYSFATDPSFGGDLLGMLDQRWYTLQAALPTGAVSLAGIGIFDTRGGVFDQPGDTTTVQIGSADLRFHNCSSATLTYRFTHGDNAGRNGSLDLKRVTPVPPGCHL